jgi:hypothetical protein
MERFKVSIFVKLLLINAIVLQLCSHLTLDEAMILVVSFHVEGYKSSDYC